MNVRVRIVRLECNPHALFRFFSRAGRFHPQLSEGIGLHAPDRRPGRVRILRIDWAAVSYRGTCGRFLRRAMFHSEPQRMNRHDRS